MPSQPPRFSPVKREPGKAWQRPARAPDKRRRGRPAQRERAMILAEEPLCRLCGEAGRVSASEEVDHIVPLSQGGSEERSNKQGLCKPCHKAKTAAESAAGRRRCDDA
ncbi:MAG TPA: HNH endonuclease signature motif containing protein [Sphingomicrobium sp.]|nr:HNH endonuclease signature motif containing protein [Sphingomicrobium sp.]